MHLHGVVSEEAAARGLSVSEFSSRVWAGIREHVKRTGRLFGTKYKPPPVESKSYNDHFNDLVAEKAKFLGITPAEMVQRLQSGDANLLSYMLATPALYGIYQSVQQGEDDGPRLDRKPELRL